MVAGCPGGDLLGVLWFQAAVETVKGVMAQHHLVVRSSLLAPLALMATVPADLLPKKQVIAP